MLVLRDLMTLGSHCSLSGPVLVYVLRERVIAYACDYQVLVGSV